jgi:hypothetical protein
VATPYTDCSSWFGPPFLLFRDTLLHFCQSHVCGTCSVYVSVIEYYVHSNIYTWSLLKINAVDSKRTIIFLLSVCVCVVVSMTCYSIK